MKKVMKIIMHWIPVVGLFTVPKTLGWNKKNFPYFLNGMWLGFSITILIYLLIIL